MTESVSAHQLADEDFNGNTPDVNVEPGWQENSSSPNNNNRTNRNTTQERSSTNVSRQQDNDSSQQKSSVTRSKFESMRSNMASDFRSLKLWFTSLYPWKKALHSFTTGLQQDIRGISETVDVRQDIRRTDLEIISAFKEHVGKFLDMNILKQILLSIVAGMFITVGAMLSIVLSADIDQKGFEELLLGIGFAVGFALVIVSGSILFTEVNVLIPVRLIKLKIFCLNCIRFWIISFVGNFAGTLLMGLMMNGADVLEPVPLVDRFREILGKKLYAVFLDGVAGWFKVLLSAIIANFLVGMAAFFGTSGRTLSSKLIGITVPILAFVALGVQHSPANLGYFSLAFIRQGSYQNLEVNLAGRETFTFSVNFGQSLIYNIIPAALGNIIGAAVFVSALFSYVFASRKNVEIEDGPKDKLFLTSIDDGRVTRNPGRSRDENSESHLD
eukprot:gb/GECH01003242.1/.p1 GENE.gb/GECH01003242.1/~~gb/GECH01003242.1/.p1  ORF type:complete len:443 (+),score=43.38 gb/GECH01003242.1/:1-1329(+)